MEEKSAGKIRRHALAALIVPLLILLTSFARVDYSLGDNRLTLLTTQSILDHGTIQLDAYFEEYGADSLLQGDRSTYLKVNGHSYNYFPLGTSLVAIPFVGVANLFGLDMVHREDMILVRTIICAIVLIFFYWVLYRISLLYFEERWAAILSVIFLLGSQAASTMMVGHWSHNLSTLALALLVLNNLKLEIRGKAAFHPVVFGLIAFMAYFTRPAAAIWIILLFGWLLILNRRAYFGGLIVLLSLFGLFVLWSKVQYGQWLPEYYFPSRLADSGQSNWMEAFVGNLVSPARGLIVFLPLTLFAVLAPFVGERKGYAKWLLLIGIFAHLAVISKFPHWWGGWSYGPRLQTESIPAIFALVMMTFSYFRTSASKFPRLIFSVFFLIFSICGIFVHTVQGAYQPATRKWNGTIDLNPEIFLWDWEFPQFLAGYYPDGILEKKANYVKKYNQLLVDVPQGSAFFFPAIEWQTPYLRRLTRGINSRKTFGDIFIFNDWEHRPEDRPIHASYDGVSFLNSLDPSLVYRPVKKYPNLSEVVRRHYPKHVFVVSNCFEPSALDSESKELLRSYRSDIADSSGTFGLLMLVEEGALRWEIYGRSGVLKKDWYHKDFSFFLNARAGNCEETPKARFEKKPLHTPGFQSYVFVLDDKTGTMTTIPMLFRGVDTQASATFLIEPSSR